MTSHITGLTLPGIIDDPGCLAGRLISFSPIKAAYFSVRNHKMGSTIHLSQSSKQVHPMLLMVRPVEK